MILADIFALLLIWANYKAYRTIRYAKRHGVKTPLFSVILRDGEFPICLRQQLLITALLGTTCFLYAASCNKRVLIYSPIA